MKLIIFILICITVIFLVAYSLKTVIYTELQKWSDSIQLRLLHCCVTLNFVIIIIIIIIIIILSISS